MTNVPTTRRALASALIGTGLLALLLILGGFQCWRSSVTAPITAGTMRTAGPVEKIATWIEPPPSQHEMAVTNLKLALEALDLELRAVAARDLAIIKALEDVRLQVETHSTGPMDAFAAETDAVVAPQVEKRPE